jgi:uncharacterized protein YggE
MTRWTVLGGLTLGLLLVAGYFLHGQTTVVGPAAAEKKSERKITTSGMATVRVKPDAARLFFSVDTIAATIKQARADSAQQVKKVLEALKALQIPDLKMKTSDVNVQLIQRQSDNEKLPQIIGYRITNSFTVLITGNDAQKLGQTAAHVLDAALDAGVNGVQQIVIFKQDTNEAKRQALTRAVEEAVANARALAAGANAAIRDTIEISGQPQYYFGSRSQLANMVQIQAPAGDGEETPVLAGEVEVTCSVSVTCTY